MSKFLKFFFVLITAVSFSLIISCGGDDDDDDDDNVSECPTFTSADSVCFCGENPNDANCVEPVDECPTFTSADSVCYCTANPEAVECVVPACAFEDDPKCFCEDNPDDAQCASILVNGDFEGEAVVQGIVGTDAEGNAGTGNNGGDWFFAGAGTRAVYEIVPTAGQGDGASGDNALAIELLTEQPNHWEQQIVNTQAAANPGKLFLMTVWVKPDEAGRQVRLAGGVSQPGYFDMAGTTDFTLNAGWNYLSIYIQHAANEDQPTFDPATATEIRAQINMGFPEPNPIGTTFVFDDLRVIEVGDQVDPESDDWCIYFPNDAACATE